MTSSSETIIVNFHIHSIMSDGDQTPESLAADLAAAGVRYAALTDHDSIEGLIRFQDALKKRGIASLTGVELTTQFEGREVHLLGYGFNPHHPDLIATLNALHRRRDGDVYSIADSIRKISTKRPGGATDHSPTGIGSDGLLEIDEAIDLLHRAGGKAFLAHPFLLESDLDRLEELVRILRSKGLDGLEAIYASFSQAQRQQLLELAKKQNMLVSAGTDFHSSNGPGDNSLGIEMPRKDWIMFRAGVFSSASFQEASSTDVPRSHTPRTPNGSSGKPTHLRRRSYVLRIFFPTLSALGLFLAAIWGYILPSFEDSLLERKREMIRELTNSAWSILASYERDERNGIISRHQAQTLAIARIEALRYGSEAKDYFWLQDMQPRMIMHPYRSDLNGRDLHDFKDPSGIPIFVEFANLVRRQDEGYIDYVWQWKDDPLRLEPKESYIKGFKPWSWVIGTGLYTNDVKMEIARIEKTIFYTSLGISGVIVLLLLYVLQQSLRIELERQEVVDSLEESTERYHTLIEAATEGMLLILDERCRYANPTFLRMTGYTARQVEFLEPSDLLPSLKDGQIPGTSLDQTSSEVHKDEMAFDGVLRHADGRLVECVFSVNPITFAGQRGFILLARDVVHHSEIMGNETISRASQNVPVGIFRARAARRGILLEMNQASRELMAQLHSAQPALADLFPDTNEFEMILKTLHSGIDIHHYILPVKTAETSNRYWALSACLVRDTHNNIAYIDGILDDITAFHLQNIEQESLIEKCQASLLFLHEPIASLDHGAIVCDLNTSIEELSYQITNANATAALISTPSENGAPAIIGILTDHDLRARVLAKKLSSRKPVHTIMSSPLITIHADALLYEALMRMEEHGIQHLVVESRDGDILGLLDINALIQFQRYGPIVLVREISRAGNPDEIVRCLERTVPLAKTLLDSSAIPRHVTNMLASICDAATQRLIQLAIEQLGPAPADFAFIAMGSQGRREQTLLTDQDNGIIFAASPDNDPSEVNRYFLELGKIVCDGLHRSGYSMCRGNVMASNPRWCRSLSDWIAGFKSWIHQSQPQELIDMIIFFDFRTVFGNANLSHELRSFIHQTLDEEPAIFHHIAKNALSFRTPFRLPGHIYLSGGSTEHAGEINLKDAMMPMVSFARLYALHHHMSQTHTIDRIEALCERNVIVPSSRDEIIAAYNFLMHLRLKNQITDLKAGRLPQNIIHPNKLGYTQKELLKQAFAQITAVQKKIGYDFSGGV